MSFWSGLLKVGAGVAAPFTGGASLAAVPMIDAIGAGVNGATQAAAANRGTKLQATMDADMMRMRADEQNRAAMGDATKKLAQAAYIGRGGASFTPTTPYSYSFAPSGASDAQKQGAALMEQEMLKRMKNPVGVSDYDKAGKMGFWEKLGNVVGPAASMFGAAMGGNKSKLPGQIGF